MDKYTGCYGGHAKPSEIQEWLLTNIKANIMRQASGMPRTTLNIWGAPGTSKTSVVKQLSQRKVEFNGQEQNISVIDIPLAQIEEMGDILGFPDAEILMSNGKVAYWVKAVNEVIKTYTEKGYSPTQKQRTTYAPPSWVPTQAKPGVILFDDGNRASQRIMKGLMQLVQDYKTIGWEIPAGWTICFTGNPDNRMNQVTAMDTAQLTRMKHITLECDAMEWATWAEGAGIDKRGIGFVLMYPEMILGSLRTNPRSLTEFFYSLATYTDLKDEAQYRACMLDAQASLDDETVEAMMVYLTRDCEICIDPLDILEDTDNALIKVHDLMDRREPRIDIVSVTMNRFVAFVTSKKYEFKEEHVEAFKKWAESPDMPKDAMFGAMSRLSGCAVGRKLCSTQLGAVLDMYKKQ